MAGIARMRAAVRRLGAVVSIGPVLAPLVEGVVDRLGHRLADAVHALEIEQTGGLDRPNPAEMAQQSTLAPGADARHPIERRAADRLAALRPVAGDREAMRLVPQALEKIENRVARVQLEGRTPS